MRVLVVNRWDDEFQGDYTSRIDHRAHKVSYVTVPSHAARICDDAQHIEVLPDLDSPDRVVAAAVAADRATGGFDRVVALFEADLLTAALIRERLGVPGAGTDEVTVFRDKARMKDVVAAAGLRAPRFRTVSCLADVRQFRDELGAAVVLKPRRGAASSGVRVVPFGADLGEALAGVQFADYEVEEFLEGPVWHVDGLMADREMIFGRASRYMDTCYGFAQGRPLGSAVHTGPVADQLLAFTEACLRALRLDRGAFHFELIQTTTGPAFLEVGARCGGGEIPWVFQDVYGVDLLGEAIRLELGEPPLRVPPAAVPDTEHGGFLLVPEPVGHRLVSRTSMVGAIPGLYAEQLPPPGALFDGLGLYRFILGRFRYRGQSAEAVEKAILRTQQEYRYALEVLPGERAGRVTA